MMTVQTQRKNRHRVIWALSIFAPLVLALLWQGCFQLKVPDQARILCDEDNDLCPMGWTCCGGLCEEGHCTCEHGACNTEYAVDCQQGRICSGGCWQDCPSCFDDCADRSLKNCALDKVQGIWFCRKSETCMIREDIHAGQIADCLTPPPSCTGLNAAKCECLASPAAFYPPCSRDEFCADRSTQCVACVQQNPESPDDGDLDAGDFHDVIEAGASLGGDSGGQQMNGDAAIIPPGDGGNSSIDAGSQPASVLAPDCFRGIGTSPLGKTCCEIFPVPAEMVDGHWQCADDEIFAPHCDGFSQTCMSDEDPNCHNQEFCFWQIPSDDNLYHCMSFGPPSAPCLDQQWQCYGGTILSSECDVIEE